ncbi:hypothetical protein [Natrarchaeobius chitinivorans]|uniref:Uncharacterized protein n=1 Tax=Natrarchaeobius chitinivorans TaxID=1679083 RepID=A0A3N6LQR0_NATCH|nr:hypothetical protein [Natrarchaeobius chitinivorans]RQG89354.1 hypothetical protein EA473_22375 [Natrarchaeobius chitinivorans]
MNRPEAGSQFVAQVAVMSILAVATIVIITLLIGAPGASVEGFEPDASGTTLETDVDEVTIVDSTGTAIEMGPSHSRVATDLSDGESGEAALSTWVQLDSEAALWRDYYVAQYGDAQLVLLLIDGEWTGIHTDQQSAIVSTDVTNHDTLRQVGLEHDSEELRLYVDGELVDSEPLTDGDTDIPATDSFFGTVEEVRTFDSTLEADDWHTLHDDPVAPVEPGSETARLMFDESGGDETYVVYHGEWTELEGNIEWTDGLEGTTLSEGDDYEIDAPDNTIQPTQEGELAELPRAYIYTSDSNQFIAADTLSRVFSILLVSLVVLVVVAVITMLPTLSGGSRSRGR